MRRRAALRSRQLNISERQVGAGYPGGVSLALSGNQRAAWQGADHTPPTNQQNARKYAASQHQYRYAAVTTLAPHSTRNETSNYRSGLRHSRHTK
ncbi:hypothetical protein KCP78_08960 [Salmonella enterica subsp. enterica]|nr:hypothetical protein KCP78_08960 [Salmonella enterica subsp. enterica]